MKKTAFFILAICLAVDFSSKAQNKNPTPLDTVNKAMVNGQKSVTGAAQDILTNYLQVAAKNLLSNNSTMQLKLTWFALNRMDSATKYLNKNFLRTKWQRNLEFVAAVGVDKNNNFNALQGGARYNFWNRRDAQSLHFTDSYIAPFNAEQDILNTALVKFRPPILAEVNTRVMAVLDSMYRLKVSTSGLGVKIKTAIPGLLQGQSSDVDMMKYVEDQFNIEIGNYDKQTGFSPEMISRIAQFVRFETDEILTVSLNAYVHGLGKKTLATSPFLTAAMALEITQYIDQQVAANPVLHGFGANTLSELNNKVLANYQAMVAYIGRQPLLTFGYLYNYGKASLLSSHQFGFTYLQGTGGVNTVRLGQIKASLTDTLTSTDPTGTQRNFNRNIIALQVGYNQVLAVQKKVSVMELNIALEQNWASSGYVYQTSTSKFYFDAYFRARLPATPWIKFDLKYDPKGGKVFGFFDFTYNLDK